MSPAHPLAHKQACTYVFTCILGIFCALTLYVGSLESERNWNARVQRRAAVLRNVCLRDRKEELMWWRWMWVSAMLTEPAQWAWETVSIIPLPVPHSHTRTDRSTCLHTVSNTFKQHWHNDVCLEDRWSKAGEFKEIVYPDMKCLSLFIHTYTYLLIVSNLYDLISFV